MQYLDYFLIFLCYFIGAAYRTLSGIGNLRKKFPDLSASGIKKTYFTEEWNTMIATALGLVAVLLAYFILQYKHVILSGIYGSWWFIYVAALFFGWGGDKIAYKYLGSTEEALNRKIGSKTTLEITDTPKSTTTITTIQETETKPDVK